MKYLVDGQEWQNRPDTETTVEALGDRLVVRTKDGSHTALAVRSGGATYVSYRGRAYKVERATARRSGAQGGSNGEARAPMPGQIVDVCVAPGAEVAAGDRIIVLEAMKMQQPIVAPFAGVVKAIGVAVGDQVEEGQLLAQVEPAP